MIYFKVYYTTKALTGYPLSVVHTKKYIEKTESGARLDGWPSTVSALFSSVSLGRPSDRLMVLRQEKSLS